MKRREKEHAERVAEAHEALQQAANQVQYLDSDVILSIVGNATHLLSALDPEAHEIALALAYAIGPALDAETQEDDDVEQIGTQQLLGGLLVLVTSLAADMHVYIAHQDQNGGVVH